LGRRGVIPSTVSTKRRCQKGGGDNETQGSGILPMEFEFDENKRLANIERHDIDFIDADILFGNQYLESPAKMVGAECRVRRNFTDEKDEKDGKN
jgi:hypothetical protein